MDLSLSAKSQQPQQPQQHPPPPATQIPIEVVEIRPQHRNRLRQKGSEVVEAVEAKTLGSGADAFDDDDDPAWGPRGGGGVTSRCNNPT